MEELYKKLVELSNLMKAIKPTNPKSVGFSIPKIPAIKPPSMKVSAAPASKDGKMPGLSPSAKKDPKKIAEQIKSGEMSTKTQKVMLKSHANGQWYLENAEKAEVSSKKITEIDPPLKADKFEDNKR